MTVAGHGRTRFGSARRQWRRWSRRPSIESAGRTATGGVVRGPLGDRPPKGKVKRPDGGEAAGMSARVVGIGGTKVAAASAVNNTFSTC